MAEAIRDLLASSPEAMEFLKAFLPRGPWVLVVVSCPLQKTWACIVSRCLGRRRIGASAGVSGQWNRAVARCQLSVAKRQHSRR